MTVIGYDGRCRNCDKRREVFHAVRAGGGNYRRAHRNIRSSICLVCARDLLQRATPGHHSKDRWDLVYLRAIVRDNPLKDGV